MCKLFLKSKVDDSDDVLSTRSVKEIKQSLEKLSKVDLSKETPESYFEKCVVVLRGVSMPKLILSMFQNDDNSEYGVFRARRCEPDDPFTHVDDFWAPPSGKTQIGRCNLEGDPILYCANHFGTALIEAGATQGSFWVIGDFEFMPSKEITAVAFGFPKNGILKQAIIHDEPFEPIEEGNRKKNNLINEFLHKSFRESSSQNEWVYNKTAALSRYFYSFTGAFVYPSVASGLNGVNIAIKPEVAKSCVRLRKAYYVRFDSVDLKKGKLKVAPIREGRIVRNKVVWKDCSRFFGYG